MSFEAIWYQTHDETGSPPKQRRIDLLPRAESDALIVSLAAGFAAGTAGHRPLYGWQGERSWYKGGQWFRVPTWMESRIFALNEAATTSELHRGRGRAPNRDIARRIRKWGESGHWRAVVAKACGVRGWPSKSRKKRTTTYSDWIRQVEGKPKR